VRSVQSRWMVFENHNERMEFLTGSRNFWSSATLSNRSRATRGTMSGSVQMTNCDFVESIFERGSTTGTRPNNERRAVELLDGGSRSTGSTNRTGYGFQLAASNRNIASFPSNLALTRLSAKPLATISPP
jgi:hypothetical protein